MIGKNGKKRKKRLKIYEILFQNKLAARMAQEGISIQTIPETIILLQFH
jgi:hypothetical protein